MWLLSHITLIVATVLRLPGIRFGWFGLWCARKCRRNGCADLGWELAITPVNCVRYFEFDFALRRLTPGKGARCLDVSSPRLFSAFVLSRHPVEDVSIVNPDKSDLETTKQLFKCIGVSDGAATYHNIRAERLPWDADTFDCIWCISVLEHIPAPDDRAALLEMQRVLKRGGVLVVTIPGASRGYDEYRAENVYKLKDCESAADGRFFFQRWYDERSLADRVLGVCSDLDLANQEVWGEKREGWFKSYEREWMRRGLSVTCKDALYMALQFRQFPAVGQLTGIGIVCLALRKRLRQNIN